jgi:hypothetical protein
MSENLSRRRVLQVGAALLGGTELSAFGQQLEGAGAAAPPKAGEPPKKLFAGERLYRDTPYFQAFPDPVSVFASRVEEHAEYLLPLATLSLSHLSDEWQGKIHFVAPIEPWEGVPGTRSTAYHNYLCRPNWIAYRMLSDKCELACDFRYFHRALYAATPPTDEFGKKEAEALGEHYRTTREEFERRAAFFRKHQWLSRTLNAKSDDRRTLVHKLGGISFEGNWSSNPRDFPLSKYPDKFEDEGKIYDADRVLPRTEDGRDFHFIGEIILYEYVKGTNGHLLLFFDPKQRIALTTFDWT